jgi:membrane-associated phospholipid phosphatase
MRRWARKPQRLFDSRETPMSSPLDWHEENRTGLVQAARLFSNIISPPVMFALMGYLLAFAALPPVQALVWGTVYGLIISLVPILFVLWLLKTGRVAELHMSDTRERQIPYLVAVGCAGLILLLLVLFDGPQLLRCLAIFNMITLSILALINTRWLISFHATAVSAAWAIVGLVFGWVYSLLILPLILLVIVVRLYLKRHTPAQIAAGLALGAGMVFLLAQFGCFA